MKQYLILLGAVVLAIAAWFVLRDDGQTANNTGRGPRQGTGRGQRPVTGGTPTQGPSGLSVTLPADLQRRIAELSEFDWSDTVTEETLVRMEDAWDFDLSGVDFDAEILGYLDGEPITREDLRRRCVLEHGMALVRSRMFWLAGKRLAEEHGLPFGLTDEEFEAYFENFAALRGQTVEQARVALALRMKLPEEAALQTRRDFVEGLLAFFPPAEFVEQLPQEIQDSLQNQTARDGAMRLSGILQQIRSDISGDPETASSFARAVDPMAAVMNTAFSEQLFRRGWTASDSELPDGAVAAFALGETTDEILPPWLLPGEVALIETDELFELIEPMFARSHLEEELRVELWSQGLRAEIVRQGAAVPPEDIWREYAVEVLAGRNAAAPFEFLISSAFGWADLGLYREAEWIAAGFRAMQPEGWDSTEAQQEFFHDHRFFIQGWQPKLDVALFPPNDLTQSTGLGDPGPIDWPLALQRAEDFHARVTAPDSEEERAAEFDAALAEQMELLRSQYSNIIGAEGAEGFAAQFSQGRLPTMPMADLRNLLHETHANEVRNAASVLRNAAVRLGKGEISEPWKTPVGYVVVRLNNARLGGLESDYEDLVPHTESEFHKTHLLKWINDTLSAAEFEPAEAE